MRLKIMQTGEPVLREEARLLTPQEILSEEIQRLIRDMRDAMRDAPGVGLAAPQVGLPLQLLAFVVASGAGLGFVLPIARRHVKQPPLLRTGSAALVGRSASVLEEVTRHSGRVRIGGEEWSARPYDETLVIPVGHLVDVMQIEGATALVYPRE